LVARYLAGVLYEEPLPFFGLQPLNLVTLACPHLGPTMVCQLSRGRRDKFLRLLMRTVGGKSGLQMALADQSALLTIMAHPRSSFMTGLRAFARRATYASAVGDNTVPFWSAFIAPWHTGAPTAPPRGLGATATATEASYPHVEWEGWTGKPCLVSAEPRGARAGDVISGPSMRDSSESPSQAVPSSFDQRKESESVASIYTTDPSPAHSAVAADGALAAVGAPPTEDALSLRQRLVLGLLPITVLPLLLPLWLSLVLPTLIVVGLIKQRSRDEPPCRPGLLALPSLPAEAGGGADDWRMYGGGSCDAGHGLAASSTVQAWMAAQLNALAWYKTTVRFTFAVDGLTALHTHGHLVVRSRRRNSCGMDVIHHLTAKLLTPTSAAAQAEDETEPLRTDGRI